MKKMLFGICYFVLIQVTNAQVLNGKVIDAGTGSPIPGATVQVHNLFIVAGDSGQFSLTRLKSPLNIRISAIGYRTFYAPLPEAGGEIEYRLERINLFMQPVEIKGTRAADQSPFTKTNIVKREIEKWNLGQDLPFILNQTPSVIVNSDAGNGVGYTGIRIRGSDPTRINMTINGIPYNDAESQGLFFVNLPDFASSVSSIQVQRGVGTSSNGAGAFGATMNFSTNEVNTDPYVELNNSYGSFDTWKHTVKVGSGLLSDHFTLDARGSKISSNGYIDRASSDLKSFYFSGAYLSEKSSIRFNIISGKEKTYQAWYGVSEEGLKTNRRMNTAGTEKPGTPYDNETDNYNQDHFQLFFNHEFNNRLTFNTALFLTNGRGYYEQYKADQEFPKYNLLPFVNQGDTIFQTDLIRQLWLDNNFYGQVFSLNHKSDRSDFTLGGGWSRYDGNHFGEVIWAETGVPNKHRWYDLEAYKTDVNVYAKYAFQFAPGWQAFADMQYRRVLYDIDGFRDNPGLFIRNKYDFFNPKVGITYRKANMMAYASYSTGNKEPNRDDFEAGLQQQPKPERLHDYELGMEIRNQNYSWGAALFYMRYKDQLVLTGKVNDVGAYTRVNTPESFRAGIELQGKAVFTNWFNAVANLTFSRNRINHFTEFYDDYDNNTQKSIDHGSTTISFSPSAIGNLVLNFTPAKNLELNLYSKYVSRQYLDNSEDKGRSLNAYFVQDARLSYSIRKLLLAETTFVVMVNNVFNRRYEPNGYTFSYQYGGSLVTENYYYPMAGSNFMVGVNLKF